MTLGAILLVHESLERRLSPGITILSKNNTHPLPVRRESYRAQVEAQNLAGRQPTPPDFLLGYQQSKLRYWNQSQVIDIAQRFHDEQVNVSLIVVGKHCSCPLRTGLNASRFLTDFFAWKFQGDW
jgi:hypothetical protein